MPDFRVTKRRVPVKVLVSNRVEQSDVFLTPVAASHDGGETLSDLLNGRDSYLPLERGGAVTCIPRDSIAVAWIEPTAGRVPEVEVSPPTEHQVRITLVGGRTLRGLMRYSRHPDSSRLVDYLNGAPQFVALHQGERLALVNRAHIASVALEENPAGSRRRRRIRAARRQG